AAGGDRHQRAPGARLRPDRRRRGPPAPRAGRGPLPVPSGPGAGPAAPGPGGPPRRPIPAGRGRGGRGGRVSLALVTGASGFVGAHVASDLLAHGWSVRALVRPETMPARRWPAGAVAVPGDLRDPGALEYAARDCDA